MMPLGGGSGLNHVGYVVDDGEALIHRLEAAGYEQSRHVEAHPHRRRIYFKDGNGLEWEFVQYFSDDPAERNDYSL